MRAPPAAPLPPARLSCRIGAGAFAGRARARQLRRALTLARDRDRARRPRTGRGTDAAGGCVRSGPCARHARRLDRHPLRGQGRARGAGRAGGGAAR
eukprot:2652847-Prymnesium_polylepis.1